ncbi:MAG: MBL fold metallo-hydrolase [Bacteroidales bacterium]|nr:MBL fold metallo-hydrolase [Bacteroidales bacterium]MCF8458629.1 MBL fold metallo-hydrolase [Bacteroidales bacterium]
MKIHILEAGTLLTTGSDMFCGLGETNWQKHYTPNKNGLCQWTMRCLLIIDEDRKILIDTGPGTKLSQNVLEEYQISGTEKLEESLCARGVSFEDITHVILTHLHFDHCGGSTHIDKHGQLVSSFPNAHFFISKKQWDYAQDPIESDKESFHEADFLALQKLNKITFVETGQEILPSISVRFVDGHTPGQMIPFIKNGNETVVFAADLLPSSAHLPENNSMAYDLDPYLSKKEKRAFLKEASEQNYRIIFQHDKDVESGFVVRKYKEYRLLQCKEH